jgi:UDP-2,3-diacylglucosamine pyrophosphatase LpxH
MVTLGGITLRAPDLPYIRAAQDSWRALAHRRLTQTFERAQEVPFDDSSRFIFFSDCHRGDNTRGDAFAANKDLFMHALGYYYDNGFSYVEVGDGDELWKNRRLDHVLRAHSTVFDLLHEFNRENRLYMLLGNHDVQGAHLRHYMRKDGLDVGEALVLRHVKTGQRIFVAHGHQADLKADYLDAVSRFMVRNVWRRVQNLGIGPVATPYQGSSTQSRVIQRLLEWVEENQQMMICGHTHAPSFARSAKVPYFNTGSCIYYGYMTGLEIQDNMISQVKWFYDVGPAGQSRIVRQFLGAPRDLRCFAPD